jgi:hypothetical protein
MLEMKNMKTIVSAILFGAIVSAGTYFFVPLPKDASACDSYQIRNDISYCMDGATISGGTISTYC